MGILVWSANAGLGEMTAVFPVKGPIIDFCGRFIDESVGFAVGWMAWFAYCVLLATEVSVLAQTFNFSFPTDYLRDHNYPEQTLGWSFGESTSPDVWIAMGLIGALLVNLMPVRIYGEIEYFAGCFKIIMMVMMIMFNFIISAIKANNGSTPGHFWTWSKPYGFFTNKFHFESGDQEYTFFGDTARLLGIWSAMNTIFFSVQGFFIVNITAAENRNLETDETIKISVRKIALRVITLYAFLVFSVGLNVPYDDAMLKDSSISAIRRGNHSPFIIACIRSGVTGLPHLLNAFFIFSAFSVSINALFVSSRLLHALACIRNVWPRWAYFIKVRLERTTSKGVPLGAVLVSWAVGFLGFLGGRPSPSKILGRMAIVLTCFMLVVYICVSVAYLFFKTRCTIEADSRDPVVMESADSSGPVLNRAAVNYPYRTHLQWARAAFAAIGCFLFLFFNGWKSLVNPFSSADFVASYISIPLFFGLVAAYHIKDERTWNPLQWTRRATMNVANPIETKEKNPLLRRGRLHRANKEKFFAKENAQRLAEFVWVWTK